MDGLNANYKIIEAKVDDDDNEFDSSGRTFVHEAYFNTEVPENADLLLNYCDEANYGDVTGGLHIACAIGYINAVRPCACRGFDDFARLDRSGRTILHALAERAEKNESKVAVAKMLLENFRLDVDVKNSGGQTPLEVAVHNLNMDMTRLLIRHGADPAFFTLHWQEFNFQKIERSPLSMYRDIWNTVGVLVSAGFYMDWEKFLQIYIIIRAFIIHVSIGQRNRITKTLQYGEIELFQNTYDKVYKDSSEKDEHQMRKNLLYELCVYQNIVEIGKMNTANGIPIKKFILLKMESLREELGIGDKSVDLAPYKLEINEIAKMPISDKGETLLDICQLDSFQTFKLLQGDNTDLLFHKTDSLPLIGELVKSYVFKAYVRGYCISDRDSRWGRIL
ncbi:hypothetical protein TKK_0003497 [Trichogramma kaykai]|uniref:Uncharacterized protein n=1 Tax=Trichogramma kaykai TaxID=54128 RepID=A0ABD2XQ91_9HYME